MAVDNRPFKSKEQDGQGNEVIIRDQQLVEQGTATTMASGACFETRDVDDRPVKIPRDNMMNIVLECIGIILNDSSRNLGTNVQKALGLQGNTVGHSTVADFASVLGAGVSGDVSSANLDNMKTNGNYAVTGNGLGLLTVEAFSAAYIKQIRYYAVDHKTEVRYCTNGTWGNWCNMDAFGCSTASDLANLLGTAFGTIFCGRGARTSGNFNNFTEPGIYGLTNVGTMTNKPTDAAGTGILIVYSWNMASRNNQYLLLGYGTQLLFYTRGQGDSGWGVWNKYLDVAPITI